MNFLIPRRVDTPELLDEEDAPFEDVVRSLEDLRRINRYAGGVSAFRRLLRRFTRSDDLSGLHILDIGTGTSDLLDSVEAAGVRRVGVDINLRHLLYGRNLTFKPIMRIAASAFELPFRDQSVDVVTSSHFFHHFTEIENRNILMESLRVARRGVIVTDTRRNLFPLAFVKLLSVFRLVGRITRFDAPASVLRGYTVDEVRRLTCDLGSSRAVFRLMPFRFGLLIWR